jgi:hypothetical protein
MYFLTVPDQGVGRVSSPEASLLGLFSVVFHLCLAWSSFCVRPCPDLLEGHQSYWIEIHSDDLM